MVTLQTFVKPQDFVRKMIERYQVPEKPPRNMKKKAYIEEFKNPVQFKVCSVLKKWISLRYDQDVASDPHLIEELKDFINNVVAKDHPFLQNNLLQSLEFYTSGEAFEHHKKMAQLSGGCLEWEIPEQLGKAMSADNNPFPNFVSLLHFDAKDLAQQMTLIDSELFRAIRLHELAGQAWNAKDKDVRAPNLLRLISHTNRVSFWIANSILKERDIKLRAKIWHNFVILCSYLKAIRNFNGVMAILAGLSNAAVARLKHTKAALPPKIAKLSAELEEMMSSMSSFKNYRETVKNSAPPFIPFVGILLSDLTFAEDGNPDFLSPGIINWGKRSLLYGMLTEFTTQQRNCIYKDIKEDGIRQGFMRRLAQQQIAVEQLYELSLKLEPRGAPVLKRQHSVSSLRIKNSGLDLLRKMN